MTSKTIYIDVEDRSRGMNQRTTIRDQPGQPYVGEHAPERTPERTSEYVSTADQDRMKNRR